MNSSPYLQAFELHQKHCPETPWANILEVHLQHGVLHASSESFLLARPVAIDATDEQLCDLSHIEPESCAWHVWLAAGSKDDHLWLAREFGATFVSYHRYHSTKPARRFIHARNRLWKRTPELEAEIMKQARPDFLAAYFYHPFRRQTFLG